MANLSDKLSSLQFTPKPQSPAFAGAVVNVPLAQVSKYQEKNYFLCDGSEYSETTYDQLFAACGTQYNTGGETAGFFRVPNGPRRTVEVELGSIPEFTSVTDISKAVVTQTVDGVWYFEPIITGSTIASTTALALSFASFGISIDFSSDGRQLISGGNNASESNNGIITSATAMQLTGNNAGTNWGLSGRLRLSGKPTDAFVGADSRFSTFDEALQFQPMIKVYDDASNISMSLADATATKTGAIRLDSSFAAGDGVYGLVQANKWQKRILSTSLTSTTVDIADLRYTSLIVGKKYKITVQAFHRLVGSGDNTSLVEVQHDGNVITTSKLRGGNAATNNKEQVVSASQIFKATTTSLTFDWTEAGSSGLIGNNTVENTYVLLEELNNYDDEASDLA
jgi:hypothetical protein